MHRAINIVAMKPPAHPRTAYEDGNARMACIRCQWGQDVPAYTDDDNVFAAHQEGNLLAGVISLYASGTR